MTLPARPAAGDGLTLRTMRRTAFAAGVLYLLTFLSSIPAVFLLGPAITDPAFVTGGGGFDTQVRLGALLDIVNCVTLIGSAVALFTVTRRQHEGLAIGFVASRVFEGAILMIGTVGILALVTLRQAGAATGDPTSLVAVGQSLVAIRDWSFVLGTAVPALNAVLLGSLMLRSGLVPRAIPVLGLIGAPMFSSWVLGYLFGIADDGTAWHSIGVAPIFFWELSLGLWMTFKGFRKEAPLMVEAARGTARQDAATAPAHSSLGLPSKAGAA